MKQATKRTGWVLYFKNNTVFATEIAFHQVTTLHASCASSDAKFYEGNSLHSFAIFDLSSNVSENAMKELFHVIFKVKLLHNLTLFIIAALTC